MKLRSLFVALMATAGCRQIAGIDDLEELNRLGALEKQPCSHDAECAARFDDTFTCRPSDQRCVTRSCTSNRDCVERFGEHQICRGGDHLCVPLFSPECDQAIGDIASENALILGSIEPFSGTDAATGRSMRIAMKMAIDDFTQQSKGLPPLKRGGPTRPLAILHCDDQGSEEVALRAAQHLSNVVRVPAIVGAAFSGVTLSVATKITINGDTLLMSPSATSAAITSLSDNGLLWRTAPSDLEQTKAQIALIRRVESQIIMSRPENPPLRLAALHKGDAYGLGLAEGVLSTLRWNGRAALAVENEPYVRRLDYGDPSNESANSVRFKEVVDKTLEHKPDLILLYGTSETAQDLLRPIEERWPADHPTRPLYVLSDGGRSNKLRDVIESIDGANTLRLAGRILGTEPGSLSTEQGLFRNRYVGAVNNNEPIAFGASNAFDAVYLLAFAAVKANLPAPRGSDIAQGLRAILPALGQADSVPVSLRGAEITNVYTLIEQGKRVRLSGASGVLNFDTETGDVLSDILLWCPQVDAGFNVTLAPYGEVYQVGTGTIISAGNLGATGFERCGYTP